MTASSNLEQRFHEHLLRLYRLTGEQSTAIGDPYWPHYYLRAVKNRGGVGAARWWLERPVQSGLWRVVKMGLPELSLEVAVLQNPWRALFTRDQLATARQRLESQRSQLRTLGDQQLLSRLDRVLSELDTSQPSLTPRPPLQIVQSSPDGPMPLDRETVQLYARLYERRAAGTRDERVEQELRHWFVDHRFLDKSHFVQLGHWKSPRQIHNYESNTAIDVEEKSRRAIDVATSEQQRVEILCQLNGVDYPVASTVLHFAHPDQYMILDFRAQWSLGIAKPSSYTFAFWMSYTQRVREIANRLGVSLRTLDKALWEYSKRHQV